MSTVKVNEVRHLSNSGTANIVLESNANTNLQATSTLGLSVTGTLTVSGVTTLNGNTIVGNATTDTVNLISTVSGFNNFSGFTGEIRMYAGNAAGDSPPDGWLYCNGDTISETSGDGGTHHNSDGKGTPQNDYQPLFNLLKASSDWGNSSGAAWGTNTVKTPDFRSRSPVGIHTGAATSITAGLTTRTLSDAVGAETHALIIAELATHTHVTTAAVSATGLTISTITAVNAAHTHTGNTDSTTPGAGGAFSGDANVGNESTHRHEDYQAAATPHYATAVAVGTSGHAGTLNTTDVYGTNFTGPPVNPHTHASPAHTHTGAAHIHAFTTAGATPAITVSGGALGTETHTHAMTTANTGSGTAHTILSPIIAVNYIIKV